VISRAIVVSRAITAAAFLGALLMSTEYSMVEHVGHFVGAVDPVAVDSNA
jgi:hypothetical protein